MNNPENPSAKIRTAEEIFESQRGGMDYRVPTLDGDYRLGLNSLRRIAKMALRYRVQFPLAIFAVIIAGIFQLLMPRYLGQSVDYATGLLGGASASQSAAEEALWTAAGLLVGVSILRGLFTMLHNYLGEAIGQQIAYQLRLDYFEKLQRLSFSYHDKVHSGDLMTRGMLDIEGVRRFIEHGILRPILLVILVGVGAYLYMGNDVVLGLLSLSFVPFALWRASVFRLKSRALWRILQERLSHLTRIMEENLGGIRVVRAFAAQDFEIEKFDESSKKALDIAIERVGVRYANTSVMTFSYFLAMGLVLWVGGLKVLDGEITVGDLTQFLAFMTVLQMPIRQTGMVINGIARASVSGVRLFEILDIEPVVQDQPEASSLKIDEGVLRFENVAFSYDDSTEQYQGDATIRDINFEVKAGQTVGIVGPPGSGKSTIAHLIPRFYDVTSGKITIDGQDIRDVTLKSLRTAVAVVQQDTFLFTSEIDANVSYGEPWADKDRVVGATEASQLHAYIENLPEGYDTIVGERGVSLSGGQRQRLSIARSVMLKPQFMVFDDSTAAIDAATEQRIRIALSDVTKDRATIVISHRLSSLMHAEEILFLDGGSIVERGDHESLMALGGRYKALYDLQAGKAGEMADG
jgi:ATP-binding cassette, subfamily B, multidrug efflux pump